MAVLAQIAKSVNTNRQEVRLNGSKPAMYEGDLSGRNPPRRVVDYQILMDDIFRVFGCQ